MAFVERLRKKAVCYLPILLLAFGTRPLVAKSLVHTTDNILVIHSYNSELSWTQQEKKGIEEGFQDSQHAVTVYHEFLDAKRYPELEHRDAFLSYLQKKYQDVDLRLLMVADDPGLNMILVTREQYFPDLPVVFMGINHVQDELLKIPWLTGVFETHSYRETILEAQRQTQADNVIVLLDSTETGKANLERLKQIQSSDQTLPEITVVQDVTPATIAQILGSYPSHWPIFLRGQLRSDDANAALLPFEQTTQLLRSHLKNPIYTVSSQDLGHGVVGGKVIEGSYHAKQAVQLVEEILDGTPIHQVSPIIHGTNQWFFDAQELRRFNIQKTALPPASILINQKTSFYEQYRELTWYLTSVFLLGMLTILILIEAIRRQKQAEQTLEHRVTERTNELSNTLEELKQAQAQLIQTEKLSSLGQLVGGVAHEFNNPLTFIAGNIEILKGYGKNLLDLISVYQKQMPAFNAAAHNAQDVDDIDLDYIQEDMPKIFQSIARGTQRIEAIVKSLQSFACVDEQGIKPTDLNKSLDNTLLILKARIGEEIDIVKEYGELPKIPCDPGAINQVFMQIMLNAIDAVNTLEKDELKQISIHSYVQNDDWITIIIQDTGSGIAPEIQDKIFDPFFTTKPVGAGTGLGLSVAYQYIQQHNGRFSFCPNQPQGSIFTLQLPFKTSIASLQRQQSVQIGKTENR
ncbi:MAG: ATP-binding protein [Cyanobacteria bacterium P01_D01_bin.156]